MKKHIQSTSIALTCLLTTSCIIASRPQWSVNAPKDNFRVWNVPITITMSNATHDSALTIIESNVLSQTGERIHLAYGRLPEPFDTESRDDNLSSFSFVASNIAPHEVIKIIADGQGCRALFHKRTAVLAPSVHGDGHVSIQLTGHCVDAATGEPVPSFDLANRLKKIMPDNTGMYSAPIKVGGYTENYYVDGLSCHSEPHPEEAEISLIILASSYEPRCITVKLQPSCLVYTNDISLNKMPHQDSKNIPAR